MLQSFHLAGRVFVACQSSGRLNQLIHPQNTGSSLSTMDRNFESMDQFVEDPAHDLLNDAIHDDIDPTPSSQHPPAPTHTLSQVGMLGSIDSRAVSMDHEVADADLADVHPQSLRERARASSRFAFDSVQNILEEAASLSPRGGRHRESSLGSPRMDPRLQLALEQARIEMESLAEQLEQSQGEAERFRNEKEALKVEFESKIDELNLVNDELNIETQQYQMRYQEINEQLIELQSMKQEASESGTHSIAFSLSFAFSLCLMSMFERALVLWMN